MLRIFSKDSLFKKKARWLAALWTLLIVFACFIPAENVPDVDIPLADKYTHFILFAVFTLLWLLAFPSIGLGKLLLVFFTGALLGWLVEIIQGQLPHLHRRYEGMDIMADAMGSAIGVILFYICFSLSLKRNSNT